jgi:23S rRNA (guanine745-N1)-methyltransferase
MTTWICPHCHEPLERSSGSLVCSNSHSFDLAKEGYVNLLAGRQKSGPKGDSAAMLAARRRFFESGFYEPLRAYLMRLVTTFEHATVAEIGCGEGYYIGGISEHISSSKCLGSDIAKEGVRLAAKRYDRAQFAVADTNKLVPLGTESVDVLLDIFAPRNPEEFARVLRPAGHLVVVIPTDRHLAELRRVQPLLQIQADKHRQVVAALAGHFQLAQSETLAVPLNLAGSDVADLVAMTPNAWFLTPEQQQRLAAAGEQMVTAEFEVLVLIPSR